MSSIQKLMETVRDNMAGGWTNDDAAVKTWLDGTTTRQNDVSWGDFNRWLARTNGIVKMETAKADAGATDAVRAAAAGALATLNAGLDLQLSDNEIRGFLNNLVPDVFTTGERDDLLTFSNETVTRAVFYGVSGNEGAIARAREIS